MTSQTTAAGARTIDAVAAEIVAIKHGIGMVPPFYAETASVKGDESWPLWIVRNKSCNSLGMFLPRKFAEQLASAMNRAALAKTGGA